MINCRRVFLNNRLLAVFGNGITAYAFVDQQCQQFNLKREQFRVELAFIKDIGF